MMLPLTEIMDTGKGQSWGWGRDGDHDNLN